MIKELIGKVIAAAPEEAKAMALEYLFKSLENDAAKQAVESKEAKTLLSILPERWRGLAKNAILVAGGLGLFGGGAATGVSVTPEAPPAVVKTEAELAAEKEATEAQAKLRQGIHDMLAKLETTNKTVDELKAETAKKKVLRIFDKQGNLMSEQPYIGN